MKNAILYFTVNQKNDLMYFLPLILFLFQDQEDK